MSDTAQINMINLQVIAEDQVTLDKADGTYNANRDSDPKYYFWHSDLQTIPLGMDGNPEQFAAKLREALPQVNTLRLPFNEFSFNEDGTLHEQYERFLEAAAAEGFDLVLGYFGGDVQRYGDTAGSADQIYDALQGDIFDGMSEGWSNMLSWLDDHPAVKEAVYGLEIANEPETYSVGGDMSESGDTRFEELYGKHMIAIGEMIDASIDAKILVGGWRYSATFDELDTGDINGATVLNAIRAAIGDDLVWSAHFYPGWAGTNSAETTEELEAMLDAHFAAVLGDDLLITETNGSGGIIDNIEMQDDIAFLFARSYEWFAENDIGLSWFPGAETGGSNFVVIDGNGSLRFLHQSSLAHGMDAFSLDETPSEHAYGEEISTELVAGRVRNEAYQPEGQIFDDTDGIAYGFGYGGNDTITGQDRTNDLIYGGTGDDVMTGLGNDDHLFGQYGGDTLFGGDGDDHLFGGDGDDWLDGGSGFDQMTGGAGADTFIGGEGHNDVVDFTWRDGDRFVTSQGEWTFAQMLGTGAFAGGDLVIESDGGVTVFHNFQGLNEAELDGTSGPGESIPGSTEDDVIEGTTGDDTILGHRGDDIIYGGDGGDVLNAGHGNDAVYGGAGNDIIYGNRNYNQLSGGAGDDTIYTGYHTDTVDGGAGDDLIVADVSRGGDHGLTGGAGADTFTIVGDDDRVSNIVITDFEAGIDTLDLSIFQVDGDAMFYEQTDEGIVLRFGEDTVLLEGHGETVLGSLGLSLTLEEQPLAEAEPTMITGTNGADHIVGSDGDDIIRAYKGNDTVFGGSGADVIYGDRHYNELHGGDGGDTIYTGYHTDTVDGGAGDDLIVADITRGGDHMLTGGEGADTFLFRESNINDRAASIEITDFEVGFDAIDISPFLQAGEGYTISDRDEGALVAFSDGDTILFGQLEASDLDMVF